MRAGAAKPLLREHEMKHDGISNEELRNEASAMSAGRHCMRLLYGAAERFGQLLGQVVADGRNVLPRRGFGLGADWVRAAAVCASA
jgi:hypothetical protein